MDSPMVEANAPKSTTQRRREDGDCHVTRLLSSMPKVARRAKTMIQQQFVQTHISNRRQTPTRRRLPASPSLRLPVWLLRLPRLLLRGLYAPLRPTSTQSASASASAPPPVRFLIDTNCLHPHSREPASSSVHCRPSDLLKRRAGHAPPSISPHDPVNRRQQIAG